MTLKNIDFGLATENLIQISGCLKSNDIKDLRFYDRGCI